MRTCAGLQHSVVLTALLLIIFTRENTSFTLHRGMHPRASPSRQFQFHPRHPATALFALPDIGTMRLGDIKKELESYGISTRSFLEKSEMVDALEKARAEGKVPINNNKQQATTTTKTTEANGASSSSTSSSSSSSGTASRAQRIQEEIEKAKSMKVGELKKKLQGMGISTKSFFEKSEFVRAYAEAIVDGVNKKKTTGGSSRRQEEDYDPSYRDVVMQKFDGARQRLLQGTVIDVQLK